MFPSRGVERLLLGARRISFLGFEVFLIPLAAGRGRRTRFGATRTVSRSTLGTGSLISAAGAILSITTRRPFIGVASIRTWDIGARGLGRFAVASTIRRLPAGAFVTVAALGARSGSASGLDLGFIAAPIGGFPTCGSVIPAASIIACRAVVATSPIRTRGSDFILATPTGGLAARLISATFVSTGRTFVGAVGLVARPTFRSSGTGWASSVFVAVPARTRLRSTDCVFLGAVGTSGSVAAIGTAPIRTSTVPCRSIRDWPLCRWAAFRAAAGRGQTRAEPIVLVGQQFVFEPSFRLHGCGFVDWAISRGTATSTAASATGTARLIGFGGCFVGSLSRLFFTWQHIGQGLLDRWQAVAIGISVPRHLSATPLRSARASGFLLGQAIEQIVREAAFVSLEDRFCFGRPLFTGGAIAPLAASTRTVFSGGGWFGGRSDFLACAAITSGGSLFATRTIPS